MYIDQLRARTKGVMALTRRLDTSVNFINGAAQCGARVSSRDVLTLSPEPRSTVTVRGTFDKAICDMRRTIYDINQLAYQLFTVELPGYVPPSVIPWTESSSRQELLCFFRVLMCPSQKC